MKLNIRTRLLGVFLILIGMASGVLAFALVQMKSIYAIGDYVNVKTVPSVYSMNQIQNKVHQYVRYQLQHVITTDPIVKKGLESKLTATGSGIEADLQMYQATFSLDETSRQNTAAIEKAWSDYKASSTGFMALSRENKIQEASTALSGETTARLTALDNAINTSIQYNRKRADNMTQVSKTAYTQALEWIIGIMSVAVLVALGLGLRISGSLSRAARLLADKAGEVVQKDLASYATAARALAEGDLTVKFLVQTEPLNYHSSDEMGDLANSFNAMIAYLRNTGEALDRMQYALAEQLTRVIDNANSLQITSQALASTAGQAGQVTQQIATTIQQVAQGISHQAETFTRTATSVEQVSRAIENVARGAQEQALAVTRASQVTIQINTAVQQVSGNAGIVTNQSAQASHSARQGAEIVQATIQGMKAIQNKVGISTARVQELGQRSDQIGAIVETIDDIASQTNLLALNAAIEAARAGEGGKGFAVVADEVRKLAERSSHATKEIGGLIQGVQRTVKEAVSAMIASASEVENGVQHADQAGQALDAILKASAAVFQQATQAAEASQRMTQAAGQLVEAVEVVSAVVEENTASTEQMAAGSSDVSQAIENIASISEENSAAVEEVSASSEEMSAQVEEVSASAQALAEMACSLQQVVAHFKIDFSTPPPRSFQENSVEAT